MVYHFIFRAILLFDEHCVQQGVYTLLKVIYTLSSLFRFIRGILPLHHSLLSTTMKLYFLAVGVTILATACNNSPKAVETTTLVKSDSAVVVKPELPVAKEETATLIKPVEKKNSVTKTHHTDNSTTANSNTTPAPSTAPAAKKGWSKTAKGAVIGGVVGAGTGAIINKRNRGAGAVIGGVLGAGTGAVIGNQMDKKDGRH